MLQEIVTANGLGIRRLRRDAKNWTPFKKFTHQKQKESGEGRERKRKGGREGWRRREEEKMERKMFYVYLYDFMWYLSVI